MRILFEKVKRLLRPGFLLLLMIPLVVSILIGSFVEKQQKVLVVPIGIVDGDQSPFSKSIIEQMKKQDMLIVHEISLEEADRLLARNELDSVFVILPQFQNRLLDEEREGVIEEWKSPRSVAVGIVQEVVASQVTKISSAIKAANTVERLYKKEQIDLPVWQDAYDYALQQWEPKPLMTIDVASRYGVAEIKKNGSDNEAVPQSLYLGIWSFMTMVTCFFMCDWIVKERFILFSRVRSTFTGLPSFVIQTAGAYFVYQIVQAALSLWLLSHFGLIEENSILLVAMILFILFSISISVWLAFLIQHLGSYYVAGILISFIIAILGGSFFPVSELSPTLEVVSRWLPQHIFAVTDDTEWIRMTILIIGSSFLFWHRIVWRLNIR
ncbi:ABC transporter permease [Niallia oryzisoli]|uniref:ABC transporter permease n=1 Tax=Niallia oryzisoli TaxID=1737571 RepID=A0ABZ2CAQ1_9BACI